MKIIDNVHAIKLDFNVTNKIKRFVCIYLIVGKENCYLIDTGVSGCHTKIVEYISSIGRDIKDIKAVFLTHSHPDHIGSAYELKEITKCSIYGCSEEASFIENIEEQFKIRPIPNFHVLLNKSVKIDYIYSDKEEICLEPGITIKVIKTPGHSDGSTSFLYKEKGIVFTGDAIPVKSDIPIYTSYKKSIESFHILSKLENITYYCSAWDIPWDVECGRKKISDAENLFNNIHINVKNALENTSNKDEIFSIVCKEMNMEKFKINPLFKTSILSNINEME